MKDRDLDEIDAKILKVLDSDGRKPYNKIAKELGKHHLTIKNHMEELDETGIIKKYTIDIDYEKLGYAIIALIEVTIDQGKMLEVESEIAKNPYIFAVYDITGEYDAVILARFKTRQELSGLVKEVNSKPYVIRTNTHLILNVIKEGSNFSDLFQWNVLNSWRTLI